MITTRRSPVRGAFRAMLAVLAMPAALAAPAVQAQLPVQEPRVRPPPAGAPVAIDPRLLPPGPTIADWQPRERVPVGGTIVLTGTDLRPADLQVVIGPAKQRLPVRVAESTATRIVIDVPAALYGVRGALVAGYRGTQARTLDGDYVIDELRPRLVAANAGVTYPYVQRAVRLRFAEFPGVRLDGDDVVVDGTCGFRERSKLQYAPVERAADLSIELSISGWFETVGDCELRVTARPLAADGSRLAAFTASAPFTVSAPVDYVIDATLVLQPRLQTALAQFGAGSLCTGTPGGQPVGVLEANGDLVVLVRGGPLDVWCTFRTQPWLLPEGLRLKSIEWGERRVGNRCSIANRVQVLPGTQLTLDRGAVLVRPATEPLPSSFVAFSDFEIVFEGVRYASDLRGPRTLLLPMVFDLHCFSSLTVLQTAEGRFGPTVDPQSFGIVLERVVFSGPPGLTLP